jgi:hypothetical protein
MRKKNTHKKTLLRTTCKRAAISNRSNMVCFAFLCATPSGQTRRKPQAYGIFYLEVYINKICS